MADWLSIVLLGIIEGITEFLPVSSTGHLLIAEHWLPRQTDLFNIVIQSGAVIAVIPLFKDRIFSMLNRTKEGVDYAAKVILCFFITGVGGLTIDKLGVKLPENMLPVALALLIGGIAFLWVEKIIANQEQTEESLSHNITWKIAIAVAFGQLIAAVFPGASRSGTTIVVMLLMGLSRVAATEFTFLVGIPTIMASGGYKMLKAFKSGTMGEENWSMIGLGFIISAIVSFVVVKWLLRYVQTHTFSIFGWYRVVFGGILLILSLQL